MNAKNGFELVGCEENAVLSVDINSMTNRYLIAHPMFTAGELMTEITKRFLNGLSEEDRKTLLEEGLTCKILRPGKSWQAGKVRVRVLLEVSSEEPENGQTEVPSYDMLQILNENQK
ncbi:KGK domain-containing protein [Microcoleus sp. FACHB-68]|uniref:KGK domain-containing protein n=1 Tax=Microcoleus sp. FACHB-68 TaxID=2692826 RepID=UPI001683948D|nr:KGK domain-containing protein [Microcoleus sp. FACHB-68]MBD1936233.1 hypothetical protein [Microcoleus sp. FACHB-68]